MKRTILYIALIIYCSNSNNLSAQILPVWATAYAENYPFSIHENDILVDKQGNVYVNGYSGDTMQIAQEITIKYDTYGNLLWTRIIDSIGYLSKIALDDSNNIFIVGSSNSSGLKTYKYNSSGALLWSKQYASLGYWYPTINIITDDSSCVYITGTVNNGMFSTIKYDANGNFKWLAQDSISIGWDYSFITIDKNRNIYVAARGGDTTMSAYLFKYNNSGIKQWQRKYLGNYNPGLAAPIGIKCDDKYIYLLADANNDNNGSGNYAIVKYNTSGNQKWIGLYSYNAYYNNPRALAFDKYGNVYVTGNINPGSCTADAYATVKFDSSGTFKWVKTYTEGNCDWDIPSAIIVDSLGFIYVTGESADNNGYENFATIKYDTSGNEVWISRFNYFFNSNSSAQAIRLDNQGNIYVSGTSDGQNTSGIVTIKYSVTTGISELKNDSNIDISIYPNPTMGKLNINIQNNNFKNAQINITNIQGEKVLSFIQEKSQNTIDVGFLNSGLYFLDINIDGKRFVTKVAKE